MQSETGFPSSHQLTSYVASKSRLKLAARAVLSADAGLLVMKSNPQAYLIRAVARILFQPRQRGRAEGLGQSPQRRRVSRLSHKFRPALRKFWLSQKLFGGGGVLTTSSSAIAERLRDTRVTLIRKIAKWNF